MSWRSSKGYVVASAGPPNLKYILIISDFQNVQLGVFLSSINNNNNNKKKNRYSYSKYT